MEYVVEMLNIRKEFPGIVANDNITLRLKKGEVHALLGENGAGKSTLMSILFGMYVPEQGIIKVRGKEVKISNPNVANELGIGMVHQHFKLVHNFTVTQNIILGSEPKKGLVVDVKSAAKKIEELSKKYGLNVDPYAKIEDISVGMQQRVEILKMLYRDAEVLILDEPTAGLDPKERINIRNYIAELSKDKIILFATHVVSDIECIADCVLLLKKGEIIAQGTPIELIEAMSGKVGEIKCCIDEVEMLQNKYKIGNIRQRKEGLALRIVGDELPEEAVITDSDIDLEDVYLYYFE